MWISRGMREAEKERAMVERARDSICVPMGEVRGSGGEG